jgi:hypothetical protein
MKVDMWPKAVTVRLKRVIAVASFVPGAGEREAARQAARSEAGCEPTGHSSRLSASHLPDSSASPSGLAMTTT